MVYYFFYMVCALDHRNCINEVHFPRFFSFVCFFKQECYVSCFFLSLALLCIGNKHVHFLSFFSYDS